VGLINDFKNLNPYTAIKPFTPYFKISVFNEKKTEPNFLERLEQEAEAAIAGLIGEIEEITGVEIETDVTEKFQSRNLEITITDNAGLDADTVLISLYNPNDEIDPPKTGKKIKVEIGYAESETVLTGEYIVDEINISSPPDILRIGGSAAAFDPENKNYETLQKSRSRSFKQKTIKEIVELIGKENKLKTAIGKIYADEEENKIDHIDQTNESDGNFLTRLAEDRGATFKVANGILIFAEKSTGQTVSGKNIAAVTIGESDIAGSWEFANGARNKYKSVTASYRGVKENEDKTITIGEGEPSKTLKRIYPNLKDATAAAKSELKKSQRTSASFSATVWGNPELKAETTLIFQPVIKYLPINTQLVIESVSHTLNKSSGFTSQIDAIVAEIQKSAELQEEQENGNGNGGSNG
jgi:phage protein D